MRKAYINVSIVLSIMLLTLLSSCAQESKSGLIGVYYNKIDLTYPKGMMMLDKLSQSWDEDEDYKAGSAAVWQGYLESPFTGEISLQLTTTKYTVLRISEVEMEPQTHLTIRFHTAHAKRLHFLVSRHLPVFLVCEWLPVPPSI